jgi:arylsulfatase A-like enzyme/Tfp pilus assembly protein PilF
MSSRLSTALPLAALLLAGACARGGPAAAPEAPVVLISVDTLRADHLPAYGYRKLETPHLDALAADSVLFERAYSHYPLTFPAHASILTGLLPPQHGVRDNKGYLLGEDQLTLAERLRAAGYRTGGFVSSMVLGRQTGIGQGFEEFDDRMEAGRRRDARTFAQRKGEATVALAEAWLDRLRPEDKPFLFLHLFEPHTPYQAPEPYASRYTDPYDAEIAYSDHLVGGFLADLKRRGLYDRALVVFLSDHGEGRGDHGELEHGLLLYRETVEVPLLVKLPGQQRRGQRVKEPAALIDVAPTLLALLGLDRSGLPGAALFEAGGRSAGRPIYAETFFGLSQYGWSELRSVVTGDLHFIQAPRPELYDLAADPGETRNLLPARPVPEAMTRALAAVGKGRESTRAVSAAEAEQLAALGYLGGAEAHEERSDRPDPKDHVREVSELWSLMDKVGATDSLTPELRILQILSRLAVKREYLSRVIAGNLMRAGRVETASKALAPFSASSDPATRVVLGQVAAALGRLAEAASHFEAALRSDPESATAWQGLGILLLGQGRLAPARTWLDQAVARDPSLPDAWNALGVVRAQAGDARGAVDAWERAVALDAGLGDAWFNLATVRSRSGDREGAARALERYLPLAAGPDRARAQALLAQLRGRS